MKRQMRDAAGRTMFRPGALTAGTADAARNIGLDARQMNALIFVLILAFAPGATVASVGVVWLLLVVVEWLADRFADCLWRGRICALRRSPSAAQTATMAGTGNSTARSTHACFRTERP